MPATLTKIINGKPAVSDDLKNEQFVKCPRCHRTYRLGYSDSEWNKVKDWIWLAETAIDDSAGMAWRLTYQKSFLLARWAGPPQTTQSTGFNFSLDK
jgi:hypothetical protein